MARYEEKEFKFPDEIEDSAETEIEIEIEDDTPEEDRGRTPSNPEKVKKLEVEVDDLDKYSKDAKDKLIRMKRVWNDERRARELAEREQNAAVEAAQRLYAENRRIKELINSKADEYQETIKETAKFKLNAAKKAFKDAYEAGDSDAMTDAQEQMTEYQVELNDAKGLKQKKALQEDFGSVQPPQQDQYIPQQVPQNIRPDPRVMEWQEENPWFGQNKVMTATALGAHEELSDEGIEIGSEEYYESLDKTMRKRFPDHFGGEEYEPAKPKADKRKAKPATVVASANRSTSPKRVRLNNSQVSIAKKLGLTPEQYVRELLKLEA